MEGNNGQNELGELNKQDRQALFGNEAFIIGMLQVVSLAAIGFTFSNYNLSVNKISTIPNGEKMFLTSLLFSLITAIASAFFRHQYKKWDIKAQCSKKRIEQWATNNPIEDSSEYYCRKCKANFYLDVMRNCIFYSVIFLITSFLIVIVQLWF